MNDGSNMKKVENNENEQKALSALRRMILKIILRSVAGKLFSEAKDRYA